MDAYAGFEPQVGEIRGLRTFRVGPGGLLYPLFTDRAWTDGTNTARCRSLRHAAAVGTPHPAPDPDCTCGFYAYATEDAALEYPHARHVLAVVACWGRVVAGTRGMRTQHARIEALWMSSAVPPDLRAAVVDRYPTTTLYDDKQAMLAAHPPAELDCFEPEPRETFAKRVGLRAAMAVALFVGLMPVHWLGSHDARITWACELGFFVVAAAVTHRRRTDLAGKRQTLLFVAIVLWLLAPYAGTAGTMLLRLPMVQIAGLTVVQRVLQIRDAGRFPARIGPYLR